MTFFRYLYYGTSLDERRGRLSREIKAGRLPKDVYVIALPEEETHLVSIHPGKELQKGYQKKSGLFVIGLAGSLEEAQDLSGSIIAMIYKKTGAFGIRQYFEPFMKETL